MKMVCFREAFGLYGHKRQLEPQVLRIPLDEAKRREAAGEGNVVPKSAWRRQQRKRSRSSRHVKAVRQRKR